MALADVLKGVEPTIFTPIKSPAFSVSPVAVIVCGVAPLRVTVVDERSL